jgi:hypothetical protein
MQQHVGTQEAVAAVRTRLLGPLAEALREVRGAGQIQPPDTPATAAAAMLRYLVGTARGLDKIHARQAMAWLLCAELGSSIYEEVCRDDGVAVTERVVPILVRVIQEMGPGWAGEIGSAETPANVAKGIMSQMIGLMRDQRERMIASRSLVEDAAEYVRSQRGGGSGRGGGGRGGGSGAPRGGGGWGGLRL